MMSHESVLFLQAAANLVRFQESVLAHFEVVTGMSAYDYWIRKRVGRARGQQSPECAPWRFWFHGLEVEAAHSDGRHLRIELGPDGMTNVFTGWSVAIHVVDSRPPWPAYAELKAFLKAKDSVDQGRASELEQALLELGMFGRADPTLFALRQRYSLPDREGTMRLEIPPEFRPTTVEDTVLCERLVLTEKGRREAVLSLATRFEPRALSHLLAGSGSYAAQFKLALDSIDPGLASELWRLESLSPASQRSALGIFLEYACTLQHIANIELGRAALLESPPNVRRDYLAEVVRTTIDLTDEWELRRLLEILSLVDVELARELARAATAASNPDIAEAGADMLSLLATAD